MVGGFDNGFRYVKDALQYHIVGTYWIGLLFSSIFFLYEAISGCFGPIEYLCRF